MGLRVIDLRVELGNEPIYSQSDEGGRGAQKTPFHCLYVSSYICVRACVCVCVCVWVGGWVGGCVRVCVCMHRHTRVCHMYMYTHIYVHTHMSDMYKCMHLHLQACMRHTDEKHVSMHFVCLTCMSYI